MKEVWIFADWNKLTEAERNAIIEMNVTDVVLGVAMGPTKWSPIFTTSQLIEHVKWLHDHHIRAHLMFWLYRKEEYIKQAADWLYETYQYLHAEHLPVSSIMFDCEKHWHLGKHMKLDNAVSLIKEQFAWAFELDDLRVGVTGLAKLQPSVKPILDICDYGIGQGYAVWFPDEAHFSHSKKYEPGNPEWIVHDTWGVHSPGKIIMGLACYYEKRPPRHGLPAMSQIDALTASLKATTDMKYDRCAYWSLNHCIGNSKSKVTRRKFIKQIKSTKIKYEPPTLIKDHPISISSIQWLLEQLEYSPGPIDGISGPLTMKALNSFRKNYEYPMPSVDEIRCIDMSRLISAYRNRTVDITEKKESDWDGMAHLIPPSNR